MNEIISDIIVGLITAGAAIWAAKITARGETKKGVAKVEAKLEAWKLLYEHDAEGQKISGDLTDLISAINSAYQIKVRIQQKRWSEVMDAQWLFVENEIVHALNTTQVSLGPDAEGNYKIFDDPYRYLVLVNTRGNHNVKRVHFDGRLRKGTKDKPTPENTRRRMAWYAMIPDKD